MRPSERRADEPIALGLPDLLGGFAAGTAPVTGPGWVRRRYDREGGRPSRDGV